MRYTDEEIRSMASRIEVKLNQYYFENGADYVSYDEDEEGFPYEIMDLNLNAKIDQYIEAEVEDAGLSDEEFSEVSQVIYDVLPSDLEDELEDMVREMLKDQADFQKEVEFMRRDNRDFI